MNEEILHLGYLILRHTREETRKNDGEIDIKQRIYMLHVNGDISLDVENDDSSPNTYNSKGILETSSKQERKDIPRWAKKLEREISKKTHPDKLLDKSEKEIEDKTEMLLKARKSVEDEKYIDLLPIALGLGIDFSALGDELIVDIQKRISEIQKNIIEIQQTIPWQWNDYSEDQKIQAIDIILKRSGINRTKAEIKKAVNKRIKRKVGTRPKTLKEIRGLK
tara:strand:+ start:232 stop:897 length:666 start_codon:yes stop_codon:yes gene_type:complete